MPIKLNTASGGGVILQGANTAVDTTLTVPAVTATVLTDSSGVLNIGSGQVYKDASGNVGIGTTPATGVRLDIRNDSTTTLTDMRNANASGYGIYIAAGSSSSQYVQRWADYNNNALATITGNGNLLVNTTNATTGRISVMVPSSLKAIGFRRNSTTYGSDTEVGSITCDGSTTVYSTSSDYRLKENVQPMVGALATVSTLKPCTYTWKDSGLKGQGFIAHELQAVVPQCVTGEKDALDSEGNPIYQGIDTSFLVATLTAAIQELKAEVDQLRAQVEAK